MCVCVCVCVREGGGETGVAPWSPLRPLGLWIGWAPTVPDPGPGALSLLSPRCQPGGFAPGGLSDPSMGFGGQGILNFSSFPYTSHCYIVCLSLRITNVTKKAGTLSLWLTVVFTVLKTISSAQMDPIKMPRMNGELAHPPSYSSFFRWHSC